MITIVSQNSQERKQEIEELFLKVKPYLDKGYPLGNAVIEALNKSHRGFYGQRWYKDLRDYVEEQGYRGRY